MLKKFLICFLFINSITVSANSELEKNIKKGLSLTVNKLESAILRLNPKLEQKTAKRLGALIAIESKRHNLDPRIVLSIINTESKFNQKAVNVNKNGSIDISMAQINLRVWTPEHFKKMTGNTLDIKRLKNNEAYAISRMCLILVYLRDEFSKKDKYWFARYHSTTPEFKHKYLRKLAFSLKKLEPYGNNLLTNMPDIRYIRYIKEKNDNKITVAMLE